MIRAGSRWRKHPYHAVTFLLVMIVLALPTTSSAAPDYRIIADKTGDREDCTYKVLTYRVDRDGKKTPCPARVIVTGQDEAHFDGSGHGLYADGRFFAEEEFTVQVPPGKVSFDIQGGPNYRPVEFETTAQNGRRVLIEVLLHEWFSPERYGWYPGDNHVHAQHDRTAEVMTSLAYAALQARANGLSFITEAGSEISYDQLESLSRPGFLLGHAPEIRPGPFIGHINTPGADQEQLAPRVEGLLHRPLPIQGIVPAVHQAGGAVIHTHLLMPVHQIHWMGAGEAYADSVHKAAADAWDVNDRQSQLVWFAGLNLGNRIAASASTDSALGRARTPSPGDRRVYCHMDRLENAQIVEALRHGRTFATNGGPLFPFWKINNTEVGGTVTTTDAQLTASLEIYSRFPLRSVEVFGNGKRVHAQNLADQESSERSLFGIQLETPRQRHGWFVLRVEDRENHWAVTSPIFVENPALDVPDQRANHAVILQISNATRFIELRKQFFAHLMVSVDPGESLQDVVLYRDDEPVRHYASQDGNSLADKRIPVTEIRGEYARGWIWHPTPAHAVHFQADEPITETGWYHVGWRTRSGQSFRSDAIFFDATNPHSHQLSLVHLRGHQTDLRTTGYGEEMPLADIRVPFAGDHWWYPRETYSCLQARFQGEDYTIESSPDHEACHWFRRP